MKTIILCTLLSSISFAVLAQSDAPPSSDTPSITIGAKLPKYDLTQGVRQMQPDEFGKYVGSYELSNGKSLSLFLRGQKKYAMIDDEAMHEIVATRANTFVAKDQQLMMTIDRKEDGDAGGEVLFVTAQPQTVPQAQPVAQVSSHKSKQVVAHVTPRKSKQAVARVTAPTTPLKSKQLVASL
jgi:hypothetical protein